MGADIVEYVDQKFRSGNSVLIDRAWLSADEWAQLRAEIGRLRGEVSEMAEVLGEAYQVVGCLLSDTSQFDTEHGEKILDNLSQMRMAHDDVLPWASVEKPAPAMSNGVEGLHPAQRALRKIRARAKDRGTGHQHGASFVEGLRCAANMLEEALNRSDRAADNRDAAGVDRSGITPVFRVCTAYESGVGKGMQGRDLDNPYKPDTDEHEAWAHGFAEGRERSGDTPAAVPAGEDVAWCLYCKGSGEVLGYEDHPSGNPELAYPATVQCALCNGTGEPITPQPADGEAVAEWQVWHEQDGWGATHPDNVAEYRARGVPVRPLYAHPPAPVQAAPQEGDKPRFDGFNELPQAARDYIMWLETDADPAGTIRQNYRLTMENRAIWATIAEAAIQHRGDSRGVEG